MIRTARKSTAEDSPAEVYEESFVPALFAPWCEVLCETAQIGPGHAVLDVGCGTGVLARAAASLAVPDGTVTGIDPSEEMLAVARRTDAQVKWVSGTAESLPFPDAHFDRVLSQFAMMFFEDGAGALTEMTRVLRPGGRLAVAVCDAIDHSPGYAVLTELLHRLFGSDVATAFRAPFALGDADTLRSTCVRAGIEEARIERREGAVRFASVDALVRAEGACAWTLGGVLDATQLEHLRREAQAALAPFVGSDGALEFSMPALVVSARRP